MNKKNIIIIAIVLVIVVATGYVIFSTIKKGPGQNNNQTNNYMIQNMNVEIVKEGSGPQAKEGDVVTVNYIGTFQGGAIFDSSLNPGRTPFQFKLGDYNVIRGWELGVVGMKAGEKRKLTIPPELGYGSDDVKDRNGVVVIPKNSTLLFEIDLININ